MKKVNKFTKFLDKPSVSAILRMLVLNIIWIAVFTVCFFIFAASKTIMLIAGIVITAVTFFVIFVYGKYNAERDVMFCKDLTKGTKGFHMVKGIIIATISMLPVLALIIAAIISLNDVVKGLVICFFSPIHLLFSGAGLDFADTISKNLSAFFVVFIVATVLTIAAYGAGYLISGIQKIARERVVKPLPKRDWQ